MGRADDHGFWWTMVGDIPTSIKGMDCWLSFRMVEPGNGVQDAYVERVHAVESGRGEHE